MKRYINPETYDIAVIGAGHAGIEAALAAARLGMRVAIFAINLDSVGNMPCNPCIGGTGKGQLVRELDAMGGEMGRAADETSIQTRMLNKGKGAAVYSLRAQVDRMAYRNRMKRTLESTPGLDLKQGEIVAVERASAKSVILSEREARAEGSHTLSDRLHKEGDSSPCGLGMTDNEAASGGDTSSVTADAVPPSPQGEGKWRVVTRLGAVYNCRAVIIATGTYLKGRIYVGETSYDGGPDGMFASGPLSASLAKLGVPLRRFKTGTPCRINRSTVDLEAMERQPGDFMPEPFSFETTKHVRNDSDCFVTYTNEQTHEIIRENLGRSPLYGGAITGVGPRYCPSIEDKVVRFPDRERHQLFLEPTGADTGEMYLQGLSSSLPEEVQLRMVRTIKGLEHAVFMRTGYAIEYDCTDPTALLPTLEFRDLPGLYGAGQFNGTSGYEEAAAQGFVAGVNAALKLKGEPPLVLTRDGSYIGTLIDDLVTRGTNEPYRMMTSRSEYRLTLRQDNADERLTPVGRRVGLIDTARWRRFKAKYRRVDAEEQRLKNTVVAPSERLNAYLESVGTSPIRTGATLADLLKRPEVSYGFLAPFDPERPSLRRAEWQQAVIRIRYEGYISRQAAQIAEAKRAEETLLPPDIDYDDVYGLRTEARQKLKKIRPRSIGQAARLQGVNPADVDILLIYLRKEK